MDTVYLTSAEIPMETRFVLGYNPYCNDREHTVTMTSETNKTTMQKENRTYWAIIGSAVSICGLLLALLTYLYQSINMLDTRIGSIDARITTLEARITEQDKTLREHTKHLGRLEGLIEGWIMSHPQVASTGEGEQQVN